MPDNQFEFLKNELTSLRLDVQGLREQIESIHKHLSVCQTRCHVPGPSFSLREYGKGLANRIIEKLL